MYRKNISEPLKNRVKHMLRAVIPPGTGILAAVSGGSDSMGLLHLLAAVRDELDFRLLVGFVDHGLREGVDDELALVKAQADHLNINVVREAIPKNQAAEAAAKGSIQAWARSQRYMILSQMALARNLAFVATGHTTDDQAETVMIRLLRGTGLDGLLGIQRYRVLNEQVSLVRPLLDIGRGEIRDYLKVAGVPWAEDPSNANSRFLRTRVRSELLPLMESMHPGVSRRLAAVASDTDAVVDFLSTGITSNEKIYLRLRLRSGIKVRYETFHSLPPPLWSRMVREAIRQVRGHLFGLDRLHIEPIVEQIAGCGITENLPVPEDIAVYVDRGALYVFSGPMPPRPTGAGQPGAVGAGQWKVRFAALGAMAEVRAVNAQEVRGIELRARREGDRLFGSRTKFKEILNRAKVPRPYRDFVPILADGDQVLSCPALIPSRKPGLEVRWMLDDAAPFLDIDFAK